MTRVVLTVAGSDRPGLTQQLADAVRSAQGNWLESRLAQLGGHYVGAVLVELAPDRLDALRQAAQAIDEEAGGGGGLHVTLIEAAAPNAPAPTLHLDLVAQDRPGIVAEVTTVLAAHDVNIEDFATRIEGAAWSGAPMFRATAALRLPNGLSADTLRDALETLSGELMADIALKPPA